LPTLPARSMFLTKDLYNFPEANSGACPATNFSAFGNSASFKGMASGAFAATNFSNSGATPFVRGIMKKEDRISELMKGQFTQSGMGNSYMNKPDERSICPHCGESLGEESQENS